MTFGHHFAWLLLDCLLWCCRGALQSVEWKSRSVICSFLFTQVCIWTVCAFFKLCICGQSRNLFLFKLFLLVSGRSRAEENHKSLGKTKKIKDCLSFSITCVVSCRGTLENSCSNFQLQFGKKRVLQALSTQIAFNLRIVVTDLLS